MIQNLLGTVFGFIALAFFLSFLIQFSGLINLVLSVVIFLIALFFLFFLGRKDLESNGGSSFAFAVSLFGFIWSGSPALLVTSDFCAYQLESSTQYYSRASTPREWFSSGNITQIDSRTLTRSQSSECEADVISFMMDEQPFLIWVRVAVIGLSLWGLWASISSIVKRRSKKRGGKKSAKTETKEDVSSSVLIDRILEIEERKEYRSSRGLVQEVEACLKTLGSSSISTSERDILIFAVEKILEDLPNCYSQKEIDKGMLDRKKSKLEKTLQDLTVLTND
jgi:hypothetical protein